MTALFQRSIKTSTPLHTIILTLGVLLLSACHEDEKAGAPIIANAGHVGATINVAIDDISFTNTGGAIDSYSINPSSLGDGLSFSTTTGVISGTPTVSAPQQIYTVTATNTAGTDSATVKITVHSAATSPVLNNGTNQIATTGTAITSITFAQHTGGAIRSCTVSPTLPAGLTVTPTSCEISGTPTATQSATTHTVTARNVTGSATATVRLTVNLAAPNFVNASAAPIDFIVGTAITPINFADANTGGAIASYAITPSLTSIGLDFNTTTGVLSGTPTVAKAQTTYTVTATNGGGTDDIRVDIIVHAAPPAAPVIANASAVTATSGTAISNISFVSSGGVIASYAIAPALSAGLNFNTSTGVISGTPTAAKAATTYTVTARNVTATATATVSITVNLAAPAPVIADAAAVVAVNGTAISNISFVSSGGAIASYAITPSLSAGLNFNASTGVISGTPSAVQARTTYTVTATNATSSDDATVDITVNVAAPALVNASAITANVGEAITTATFTNDGGGALTACTVSPALPGGLAVALTANNATCQISGTPTTVTAQRLYTVTARNVTGSATATVSVTVNLAAPNLGAGGTHRGLLTGTAITPITFANSGGAIASCTVTPALPSGLTLASTSSSCTISGTPLVVHAQVTHTVTATNTTGTAMGEAELRVSHGATNLANAGAVVFTAGTAITPITFVNSGGLVDTCTLGTGPSLPAGLTVATATTTNGLGTCQISGTPTAAQVATTHDIVAANSQSGSGGFSNPSVSITVNLAAPSSLAATPAGGTVGEATADAVTLTWDTVVGATGYNVYRSIQSMADSINADPASLAGTYSATSTRVTATTHTTPTLDGKTYYFFVTSTSGTNVESDTNAAQVSAVPFATVTSPDTSRVWMSRHLGATQDCTRSTDTACYGDLYQWGRADDGHQRIDRTGASKCWNNSNPNESVDCTSLTTSVRATSINDTVPGINFILNSNALKDWLENGTQDSNDVDDNGVLRSAAWTDGGTNDICPAGFSVPTIEELAADTTSATTTPVTDSTSALASFLDLPTSGARNTTAAVDLQNRNRDFSNIWSRSTRRSDGLYGLNLYFRDATNTARVGGIGHRVFGNSVRCIKVAAPVLADIAGEGTHPINSALTNDLTFANTGGAPVTCTVSPTLPAGLKVEASSCAIFGTPTAAQGQTTHTVTGTNTAGSDTATVRFRVQ